MLYKRIEANDDKDWTHYIKTVLNNYNNKNIHSVTGFTPNYARLAKYRLRVLYNLKIKAKANRKYPKIDVGDKVRVFRKKTLFDKERIGKWSPEIYTVENIIEQDDQKLFKLKDIDKPFIRSEILLVD